MGFELVVDPNVIKTLVLTLGVVLADALLGIVRAITKGEFDWRKLPQFLATNVLPYVGSLFVLAVFSLFVEEVKAILFTSAAFMSAKFLTEIKNKLLDMGVTKLDSDLPPQG